MYDWLGGLDFEILEEDACDCDRFRRTESHEVRPFQEVRCTAEEGVERSVGVTPGSYIISTSHNLSELWSSEEALW